MKIYVFIFTLLVSTFPVYAMENPSPEQVLELKTNIIKALSDCNNDSLDAINKNGKWLLATYGISIAFLLWSIADLSLSLTPFGVFELGVSLGSLIGATGAQKNVNKILKNLKHCKDIVDYQNPVPPVSEEPDSVRWIISRYPM